MYAYAETMKTSKSVSHYFRPGMDPKKCEHPLCIYLFLFYQYYTYIYIYIYIYHACCL